MDYTKSSSSEQNRVSGQLRLSIQAETSSKRISTAPILAVELRNTRRSSATGNSSERTDRWNLCS